MSFDLTSSFDLGSCDGRSTGPLRAAEDEFPTTKPDIKAMRFVTFFIERATARLLRKMAVEFTEQRAVDKEVPRPQEEEFELVSGGVHAVAFNIDIHFHSLFRPKWT